MNNTGSKPRVPKVTKVIPYRRVAPGSQLTSTRPTTHKEKVDRIITAGDKSYLMPKELMKPIYEYKSRLNVHIVLKEKVMRLKNEGITN